MPAPISLIGVAEDSKAHYGIELAEPEGFEPSIGLYNPITV
jgi:hypothetical protein